MNTEALSLRTKLTIIIALIVSVASFPLIYFGYRDTFELSLNEAERQFQQLSGIVDEGLQLSYLNVQSFVIDKSGIDKSDIVSEFNFLEEATQNGKPLEKNITVLKFMEKSLDTHFGVADLDGNLYYASPLVARAFQMNLRDHLRVPLVKHLRRTENEGNLGRDVFTFYRIDTDARKNVPMLLGIRKTPTRTLLVSQAVDYLEDGLPAKMAELESHVRDIVKTIVLPEATSINVMTDQGSTIASRGSEAFAGWLDNYPDIYDKARTDGKTFGIVNTPAGDTFYCIRWFKPFEWYIQTAVPLSVVAAPAGAKAVKLSAMVVGIFILIALAGLGFITRVLKPLRRLSECAGRLAVFDFAAAGMSDGLKKISSALPGGRDEVGQVSGAFSHMIVAIEKNIEALKASVARQHVIEGELNAAREIQQGMLPAGTGFRGHRFSADALMEAAKEVGGDFYDVLEAPDGRRALLIGDVSGKGVSAALFMSVTLTLVRNAVSEGLTPAEVMKQVNDRLAENNPSCMFVTLWIGYFDPETGGLDYANGGHCPPVVVPADPKDPIRWIRDMSGPLVGALDMAEFTDLHTTIAPGEMCLMYTDGVSEAMNEQRELFGEDRIAEVSSRLSGRAPGDAVKEFMTAITRYRRTAAQSDDITMVVFRRSKQSEADETDEGDGKGAKANPW